MSTRTSSHSAPVSPDHDEQTACTVSPTATSGEGRPVEAGLTTPPAQTTGFPNLPPEFKSTPHSAKISSQQKLSVTPIKGDTELPKYRQQLAAEMKDKFAQIPFERFMEEFVPGDDPTGDQVVQFGQFDGAVFDSKKESELCTEFVSCVAPLIHDWGADGK